MPPSSKGNMSLRSAYQEAELIWKDIPVNSILLLLL